MSTRLTETHLARSAVVGLLACTAGGGIAYAQQPSDSVSGKGNLEEVIVTAQKRVQREQDVPTSMAVLSAAKLESQGMMQLADYSRQIPGLRVIGAAGPGQGRPVLRGLSTGTDRNALVGLYLDDVPFAPSSARSLLPNFVFDPALADVERIEVLKGPQSTLYGAHALTGLIKYVTKAPDLNRFDGSIRLDGSQIEGADSGYSGRVSANIPVVEGRAGLRVSGFYREDPGYVDDTFRGIDDANSGTVKGGRLSLLVRFSDELDTTISGMIQDIDIDSAYNVLINPTTLKPVQSDLGYSSPIKQPVSVKYQSLADTTNWDMSFATLTNIISYAEFSARYVIDVSAFGGAPATAGMVDPAKSRRISDELRLTSTPGHLEWMLGAFYTDETAKNRTNYRGTDANGVILPSSSPFFEVYTFASDATFEERAIFGNLTYHFTDRFEASLGARYNENEQDYDVTTRGALSVPNPNSAGFPTDDSANNYLATISYKPSEQLTLYARAANAYRPGGANVLNATQIAAGAPTSYTADTLWNYEVGVKGTAWGNALTYAAAIYHVDWKDTQISARIGGFSVVGNVGKAKSDGAEVSLNLAPGNGLNLNLSGAYSDAKIDANAPLLGAFKGDPLPYSPKLSLSTAIDYRHETSTSLVPHVGLAYSYYSKQNTAFQSTTSLGRPIAFELPSYGSLDIRGGIDWAQYSLVARIDNVTDEFALTNVAVLSDRGLPTAGTVLKPRTYGLSFEARF
jgi:iron complex outermembrane recepter protein